MFCILRPKNLFESLNEYKQIVWLGVAIAIFTVLFYMLPLFQASFSQIMDASSYLSWHIVFEFIIILISFCVFILPYYTYRQNHRLRGIFIANVFLITGIIEIFHMLSFKGMPFFLIENNDANRATTFWIIARLIVAIGITLVGLIQINRKSKVGRNVFLAASLFVSFSVLIIVTYFPNAIPAMFIEGVGITPIKILLEYVIIAFFCFAGIMYMLQYLKNKDKSNFMFIIAMAIGVFGELAFVSYVASVYGIYNYFGHVCVVISYFIIFKLTFLNNIERPYLALNNAKNRLKKYSGDLNRLVFERTAELQTANQELNLLNQKFVDDLEYALEIQKAILPDKLPSNEQVTFVAKYFPAERVSGDFYNIFRLDEQRIGMYIGDVSGHGVPAAMLTVFLNQSIKTTRELDGKRFEIIKPSKVLENLYTLYNKVNFRDEMYILILYAIYDTMTKELVYSSAGMNTQPLLVKKNNEISEIDIRGLPVCNLIELVKAEYTDHTIQLEDKDRVFFYTDGLIELDNKKMGESFTLPHLKEFLAENNDMGCLELYEKLDKKIMSISDISGLKDDVTFFMLQVRSCSVK